MRSLLIWLIAAAALSGMGAAEPVVPPGLITLTEDGGWCWFEDPRVVIVGNQVLVGVVSSGHLDPRARGDVVALVHNLDTGSTQKVELHDRLQLDDHDSPAFVVLPDGSVLAVYAKHGDENRFYYRRSRPHDLTRWGPQEHFSPSVTSRITYSNVFLLPDEGNRIYNFFRGIDDSYKPSFAVSEDWGATWSRGQVVIDIPGEVRHRPYARYVSDGYDTVHIVFTEGHPQIYDNSVYHVFYRDGQLHSSEGVVLSSLEAGLSRPEQGTRVYRGGPDAVAWVTDVELDEAGRPFLAFSVQVGSAGVPSGQAGEDHRYYYGRWNGRQWDVEEIAFAGSRLYAFEDDYTGLVALVPGRPETLYISTNSDPSTGQSLVSRTDGRRHHEIFRGERIAEAGAWLWASLTEHSSVDNLRPIVPAPVGGRSVLLWLRGEYRSYTDYTQSVVGIPLEVDGDRVLH